MRYILFERSEELSVMDRLNYLNTITDMYFYFRQERDRLIFISIPSVCEDICFLVGHQNVIEEYLIKNIINEGILIIVSCNVKRKWEKQNVVGKTVYLCKQEDDKAPLLSGKEFGFKFDLTESELQLFRAPKSINLIDRIDRAFVTIQGGGY